MEAFLSEEINFNGKLFKAQNLRQHSMILPAVFILTSFLQKQQLNTCMKMKKYSLPYQTHRKLHTAIPHLIPF